MKTLSLTRGGEQALGCSQQGSKRHGGPQHQYWKSRLAARLRELGYTVKEEHPIGGGKTVDLLATRDGRTIAFEIETGKSDVSANIGKFADSAADRLVIVATSARVKGRIDGASPAVPPSEIITAGEALEQEEW
jgi:hypothetical protein